MAATIIQMNQEDLRNEVKSCFWEFLEEIKNLPVPEPLPDRTFLKGACEITGLSESKIYKLSMDNDIPVSYYGKRLVFSRKALTEWMESRTISKSSTPDMVSESLVKSAKKQLKKC